MPSVKDFKNQNKDKKQAKLSEGQESSVDHEVENMRPKRRPGRGEADSVKVVDVEHGISDSTQNSTESFEMQKESTTEGETGDTQPQIDSMREDSAESSEGSKEPKIEIRFFGSELVRAKIPQPFEVAEAIATDWVYDGDFKNLPLGHPLAQKMAQQGLQKAKEVEKKVLESPITEKIMMQALTLAMKFRRKK